MTYGISHDTGVKPRYLTKSRYKLALECPIKLYYQANKEYPDTKKNDAFLKNLAKGGFQVGELAKLYFPEGIEVKTKNNADALAETAELMAQSSVTIFEAAVVYENFFLRADVVRKNGNTIEVIEVKAKSYSKGEDTFLNAKGDKIDTNWESYIADAAFQRHVMRLAYPDFTINTFLMLAHKNEPAPSDGLNQLFKIIDAGDNSRAEFVGDPKHLPDFGDVLIQVPIDHAVDLFVNTYNDPDFGDFTAAANTFAAAYSSAKPLYPTHPLGTQCAKCEFHLTGEQLSPERKSGYHECWEKFAHFKPDDFKRPHIFEIWNFKRKEELLAKRTYFQEKLSESEILKQRKPGEDSVGLTTSERQWLQVQKSTAGDTQPFLNIINLRQEMQTWQFPLHFIDFETSTVAIPFHKGRKPYEQIAFQFSHHTVDAHGKVAHVGQYICTEAGKFPNFEFLRTLKQELAHDNGTIFRYSPHENTVLNQVRNQLLDSSEADRAELIGFIESITYRKHKKTNRIEHLGPRNMVDLLEIVRKYYYHPATKGANSIKQVLPATLSASDYLKAKYSREIYGTSEIPSLNFDPIQWVRTNDSGEIEDPYDLLPPVFDGVDNKQLDATFTEDDASIADGGAAMMAFARMQFVSMTEAERERIAVALLKYCELDTLAMVMLYEAWREWV